MSNALTNKPVTMSSREIAELTGKRHGDVIRDIRNMLDQLGDDANLRHVVEAKDARGYTAAFHLPRREVEILLTGYSIPLRAKVIDRLHELEEQAKGSSFRVQQSLPEALPRRIADLKERGYEIVSVMEHNKLTGQRYARHSLKAQKRRA